VTGQNRPPTESADGIIAFPPSTERRLRVALRQLDQALAEQREAIAAFRTQLASLSGAVAGLGETAIELRERLGDTAQEAARAKSAAAQLQNTANAMPG